MLSPNTLLITTYEIIFMLKRSHHDHRAVSISIRVIVIIIIGIVFYPG